MKVLVVITGGTFGSAITESSKGRLRADSSDLADYISMKTKGLLPDDTDLSFVQPFSKLSEDIYPQNWTTLTETLQNGLKDHDCAIVIHGTDTLAYSASAISYLLSDENIVFTGSNLPAYHEDSDALVNFVQSVYASRYFHVNSITGTFIVFNGRNDIKGEALIHIANRVKKDKWDELCYRSFYLGDEKSIGKVVGTNVKFSTQRYESFMSSKLDIPLDISFLPAQVSALKIYPGMDPNEIIDRVGVGKTLILLELYNSGTGPSDESAYSLAPVIEKATRAGAQIYAVSQHEGVRGMSMDIYESSKRLLESGVIPLSDMIWESALTKLILAAGNFSSQDEIRNFMLSNIAGEISIQHETNNITYPNAEAANKTAVL